MPTYLNRKYKVLSIVNDRFIKVCEQLISDGHAKNKTALAPLLGSSPNIISDIYHGKRNVSLDMIITLCTKFKVDSNYLLPPWSDEMFLQINIKKEIQKRKEKLRADADELKLLEKNMK